MFNRLVALSLLSECTGDDIWSIEHCRARGVPNNWIEEMVDCFESGFDFDAQTIYFEHRVVNQYHGIRDIDLALRLGSYLGIDVQRIQETSLTRANLVDKIKQAVEED